MVRSESFALDGDAVQQLATGKGHTCALLVDGGVKCWGLNSWGQCGQGHTSDFGIIGDEPGEMGPNLPRVALF